MSENVVSPPRWRSPRAWGIALAESLACLLLGGVIALIAFGVVLETYQEDPPVTALVLAGVDAALGLAATAAIGPLRLLPRGRVAAGLHLAVVLAGGLSSWTLPAAALALLRLGRRRRLVLDLVALALLTVGALVLTVVELRAGLGAVDGWLVALPLLTIGLGAVPLLIGRVQATRAALVTSLQEQAAAAERARQAARREAETLVREQEAEAARVRAEERTALARDMHDSVSHHLATIALHAGALSYREDLTPETVRASSRTVRDAAQQAGAELRSLLTTLRSGEDTAPLATAPTLEHLTAQARASGQEVTLTWEGLTPDDLAEAPRAAVVALARIYAETLVNAAKHAPGSPVRVTFARREDGVHLTVRTALPAAGGEGTEVPDAGRGVSTGHGLLGVRERARLLGGDARSGPDGPDFEVSAWVPA